MRVALIQLPALAPGEDGLPAALEALEAAAEAGGEILVLPELPRWAYPVQGHALAPFAQAEPLSGPTVTALRAFAAARAVVVVASFFEAVAPGVTYNSAALIDADGAIAGTYRKSHIPDDPLFHEKFYFAPGDTGFGAFDTRFGRVGLLICWDQWFPEAARLVAMQGAELIVAPTAIAWIESEGAAEHARQLDAWRTVQRGHAIANGVYWAAVNRAGTEEGLRFWGRSFLAGPLGELLCEAGEGPETLIGCCSRELLAETRRVWPFWRDRRPELYGGLLKRFGK